MSESFTTAAVVGAGTIGLSWTALFAAHGLTVRVSDPRPDLAEAVDTALAGSAPQLAHQGLDVRDMAGRVHLARRRRRGRTGRRHRAGERSGERRLQARAVHHPGARGPGPRLAARVRPRRSAPRRSPRNSRTPRRILIGHPFNPPHLVPLVEVVPGERTGEDSVARAVDFYRSVGRVPVVERKEIPGFVGNRLQNALSREAIYLVEQGVVGPAELDTVVVNSLGLRWATVGPFLGAHLGGGPGGYRHMAEHIGMSMQTDVGRAGHPEQGPEQTERLDPSRGERLRLPLVRPNSPRSATAGSSPCCPLFAAPSAARPPAASRTRHDRTAFFVARRRGGRGRAAPHGLCHVHNGHCPVVSRAHGPTLRRVRSVLVTARRNAL